MTNDTFHTYTFDAEGNITAVDGGQTAQYTYNAQNQRVSATVGGTITEYLFNAAGQRVSEWNGTTQAQLKGKYYWGGKPVAYYAGGATHFEHQDWLGTERLRTAYNGGVEGSYISLPFGDGQAFSGADTDANHYGMLDADPESGTDHAQFRQYSSAQGRWLAPDPYSGSYSMRNPQSFNRYVYAGNNPLAAVDPTGMDPCDGGGASIDPTCPSSSEQKGTGGAGSDVGNADGSTTSGGANDDGSPPSSGSGGVNADGSPSSGGANADGSPSSNVCSVSASSLDNYMATKNSPMVGQGENLMSSGAQYNIDPRLYTSLSGAETSFGNNITAGQFNAFNVLYNGMNSPFPSYQSAINSVGHSLTNPRNGYDFTNTSTLYGKYCSGAGCAAGLRNLNTFMIQQGANTNSLHYPCN